VLVMKLTAVLKDEPGETPGNLCGLSGSHACQRCRGVQRQRPRAFEQQQAQGVLLPAHLRRRIDAHKR